MDQSDQGKEIRGLVAILLEVVNQRPGKNNENISNKLVVRFCYDVFVVDK
jgi:hypothetical protein